MTNRAQELLDSTMELTLRPQKDDRKKLIAFILRELNKQFDDWGGDEPSCCAFREIVDIINEVEAL
jgi:hypothetical protein